MSDIIHNEPLKLLSDFVVHTKYARYLPNEQRRESFEEICQRYEQMMLDTHPSSKDEIVRAMSFVREKKVLPSMRGMQFAGDAIKKNESRVYNCSYLPINSARSFSEVMFLLLGGTGVGYSVQKHHVEKLPTIKSRKEPMKYLIQDTLEGWADAVHRLVDSFFAGKNAWRFDFSDIREKGAYLVTAGGKAPGPEPLRVCLEKIESIFSAKTVGEKLSTIECHDICCHIADAVLAGGIRRAAMISLFSKDDESMLTAKAGNWWEQNGQRGRANNSAVLHRKDTTYAEFKRLWDAILKSGSGEPGIFWTNDDDHDWGINPCFTGDTLVAVADGRNAVPIKELAEYSNGSLEFPVYSAERQTHKNQFGDSGKFSNWKTQIKKAVAFKTGTREVFKVTLSDGSSFKCTPEHLLATKDGEWVKAKEAIGLNLETFFSTKEKYRTINSRHNGFKRQYRMIWEFYNGEKPKGFEINHIENGKGDGIDNLQLLPDSHHRDKTSYEGIGTSTTVHGIKDKNAWSSKLSESNTFEIEEFDLPEKAESRSVETDNSIDRVLTVVAIEDGGVEDVYDLTVDDNHNFFIITDGDERHENSSGVLVHNCAEISLRPHQMCNLTEVNASTVKDQRDLDERAWAASVLGTLQASLTDFHFLRYDWRRQCEKDALIGVGMTGIASSGWKKWNLAKAAESVRVANLIMSHKLGINPAARQTCVKPSGTTSIVCQTSSGIHAWHNDYFIRNVRVGKNEPVHDFLKIHMPELMEDDVMKPDLQSVFSFPVKAPEGALTRHESVFDLLERVKYFNQNWINPGHKDGPNAHNVSATVSFEDKDWNEIGEWIWNNKESFTGLSFLPYFGGTYQQAPFIDIDKKKYEELLTKFKSVDFRELNESEDFYNLSTEIACGGGSCEIV